MLVCTLCVWMSSVSVLSWQRHTLPSWWIWLQGAVWFHCASFLPCGVFGGSRWEPSSYCFRMGLWARESSEKKNGNLYFSMWLLSQSLICPRAVCQDLFLHLPHRHVLHFTIMVNVHACFLCNKLLTIVQYVCGQILQEHKSHGLVFLKHLCEQFLLIKVHSMSHA